MAKLLSLVMPALNEAEGIGKTLYAVPREKLKEIGYSTEMIVVDGGSEDGTRRIAEAAGAKVISEPRRGYGIALRAGIEAAQGDFIASADADHTYPVEDVYMMLKKMNEEKLDFLNTNRFEKMERGAMGPVSRFWNWGLSTMARFLFTVPFRDSQSRMWIMRRRVWEGIRGKVENEGMAFSQEVKIAAFSSDFKCGEVSVVYGVRSGRAKLNPIMDGMGSAVALLDQWLR